MDTKKDFYEMRLDRIFSPNSNWKHRTLRTVFDPPSHEWSTTTMEEKLDILKKIAKAGENFRMLIREYKMRYNENGRKDIAGSVEDALIELLQYSITKE